MDTDQQKLDQQGQDADDYYQDIVLEDVASAPDGCLGVIAIMLAVGMVAKFLL